MRRKLYLLVGNGPIDKKSVDNAFDMAEGEISEFVVHNDHLFSFTAPDDFALQLNDILLPLHDDLGISLTALACHRDDELERKLLRNALAFFPNQCVCLSDVLMKEFSFGDYSSLSLVRREFGSVPHEILLTAGTFLRCGLNASLAAETLLIHRNTFNYRLEKFIDLTGLDIRDYHNALLLEIYFQFAQPRG